MARLSTYLVKKSVSDERENNATSSVDAKTKRRVRDLLHEKLSSEKLAQFISEGIEVARVELSEAI